MSTWKNEALPHGDIYKGSLTSLHSTSRQAQAFLTLVPTRPKALAENYFLSKSKSSAWLGLGLNLLKPRYAFNPRATRSSKETRYVKKILKKAKQSHSSVNLLEKLEVILLPQCLKYVTKYFSDKHKRYALCMAEVHNSHFWVSICIHQMCKQQQITQKALRSWHDINS